MASVALYRRGVMLQKEQWNQEERKFARRCLAGTLEGVGVPATDVSSDEGRVSAIVRRLCTDDERRQVLEKYTTGGV